MSTQPLSFKARHSLGLPRAIPSRFYGNWSDACASAVLPELLAPDDVGVEFSIWKALALEASRGAVMFAGMGEKFASSRCGLKLRIESSRDLTEVGELCRRRA